MRIPFRSFIGALALAAFALVAPASAAVLIQIDKSTQRMVVSRDMVPLYDWPVSSGLREYATPSGSFKPFRMEADHFSREWDDAPMPHSIFFTMKGHAIHGTTHLAAIGQPASHGCVRLEPQNAKMLFELVKAEGMANVRVVLEGDTPAVAPQVAKRGTPPRNAPQTGDIMQDEDFTGALSAPRPPREVRGYREYRETRNGQRYVYERRAPVYVDRYGRQYYYQDAPPPPRRFGGGPFGW